VSIERARVAAELAERAFRPFDPLPGRGGAAVACELYRESIHWALLAHSSVAHDLPDSPQLATLWSEVDAALLERAARGRERLAELHSELVNRTFADFAELPESRQNELVEKARAFSNALLEALEPVEKRVRQIRFRRILFAGCGVFALLVVFVVVRAVDSALETTRDLARGARWWASSSQVVGCTPPLQECPQSPQFFFHTVQENDPWLMLDLGRVRPMSSIVVKNRVDCCSDRAVPLVVEVSVDQKTWRVVAKREATFDTWRATFPRTSAQYVKFHVPKAGSILHLKSVRVLP
jgi:hypothetical protein